MTDDEKLMQQALEALNHVNVQDRVQIITALRERLAQPEQSRAKRMRDAGYTRRPTLREIASEDEQPEDGKLLKQFLNAAKEDGVTHLTVQEPVAWADMDVRGEDKGLSWTPGHFHKTPLYTTPPQRKPLTEKRIEELYSFWVVDCQDIVGFARAVERTVKGEV